MSYGELETLFSVPVKNARFLLAQAYQLQNKKNLFLLGTLLAGYAKICKGVNGRE